MKKDKHYPEVGANPDFPKMEEKILQLWKDKGIFEKSVDNRQDKKEFIFYDGPPFANGLPHYGHLLTGFVKDIFARYQTIKGKKVERRFGWDCHGLPAEMGAEKELGISGRHKIVEYGIEKFNQQCRTSVMKYSGEWEKYVDRQARWVDFENDYKTMDKGYMESVIWAFKQLYDKGLVYESMRVMPYSWACETPLSNFETRMDNSYRERADKAVTVAFELDARPEGAPAADKYFLCAWTTTPWTLPSNLALAVGENIEYACVVVERDGAAVCYILAASSLKNYKEFFKFDDYQWDGVLSFFNAPYDDKKDIRVILTKEAAEKYGYENDSLDVSDLVKTKEKFLANEYVAVSSLNGDKLLAISYTPLFPYFANHANSFRVLSGDFVAEGDGTGVVHLAPGFGEDDQRVCDAAGIKLVCPVDNAGKFTAEVSDFQGMQVFDANDEIIKRLKLDGAWIKTEQYIHNYPHCWRTDTPLIYKAVPSWYVEVTKFKDRMVELNQQINWIPGHIRDGQFGKWLENARDWSISRNRFWGAPIPIWRSDNPKNKKLYVFGSIKELEEFFGQKVDDLHRPFIDNLTKPDPEDSSYTLRRVEDVFDCWFESGSMPYAQAHYPFENKQWFEDHFPADFIVEYVAQTRGWFYTLMVLSTALFDRPPFLNVICHGVVLDEKGQKLSKRLNNYADPMEVFDKFGADAMRWVMVSAPIMHGGELLIDKEGNMVRDAVRLVIKPVWNSYSFFALYANADGIKAKFHPSSDNLMDRYILAKCKDAVYHIEKAMDFYDTPVVCKAVEDFFEVLNNWYIRRNKDRFWKTQHDQDKFEAYNTLYSVLHIMCRAISPLLPYLAEEIWQGLGGEGESVHLADFPDMKHVSDEAELIRDMDRVRDVCNATLSIRNAENVRVRQPLSVLTIIDEQTDRLKDYAEMIKDEVNVKDVHFSSDVAKYAEHKLKINFSVLGKRLPQKIKDIIAATKQNNWKKVSSGQVEVLGEVLSVEECSLLLEPKNKKGASALASNDALVILDLTITEDLKTEGIARDLVRAIQQSRKDANLQITDRISLNVNTESEGVKTAVDNFGNYISEQTLAVSVDVGGADNQNYKFEQEIDGDKVLIGFSLK